MNKLENFSSVYYISLEESGDRRENIETQFKKYDIHPVPVISKRYSESDDVVKGSNIHLMDPGTIGCAVSHLKAIQKWYNETDEDYAFFCEDDLSLETVDYWNFTWEEFIGCIPEDADCVQLLRLRENGKFSDFTLRKREWNDWAVTAYIITRDYAKKVIDEYVIDNEYHLEIKNQNCVPLVEYLIFNCGITYSIPLFVEEIKFSSTFTKSVDHNQELHAETHLNSNESVLNWWKTEGKDLNLTVILENKNKNKKIVDYFTFFSPTGKEMLKLRINMLKNYVDEFVICESNKTQSGIPIQYELKNILKELNFSEYNIRIIELDIPENEKLSIEEIDKHNCYDNNSTNLDSVRARTRERMQKDALLSVLDDYSDDTVFIHSDIDEIISPNIIEYISETARNSVDVVIRVPLVHLEGRCDLRVFIKDTNQPKEWTGMFVTTKKHLTNATPTQIRSNVFNPYPIVFLSENGNIIQDLGWHFSWMGKSDVREIKCKAFTHYDDNFEYLTASKYSSNEMIKFQRDIKLEEGQISPSGDKNTILKNYPVSNLPKEIFMFDDIKEFLLPKDSNSVSYEKIEKLLIDYSLDTENALHNFNLAYWYETEGHTAPAVTYYLRSAERSEDDNLGYEALIRASFCYSKQGTRDSSSKCLLQQALSLCPKRPEAYFLLSKFCQDKNFWTDCYNFSDMGLNFSDFNLNPLLTDINYPGRYGLLYFKAVSGWWWGKVEETKNILNDIKNNYDLNGEYNYMVNNFMEKMGL
jgi:tetratricopeptide (TPR) repeat protein